jgi:Cu(I)/Ag(I) efflux system membrane fusion protein
MNRNQIISAALLAVFLLAAGYWWGRSTDDGNNRTAAATEGRAADADAGADEPRRVLYYRNPMGHDDTSAVPKKDPMGMDYIPVYADEVADGPEVRISANRLQTLGVRTETAAGRTMSRTIRAVGTVAASEHSLSTVSPKFEGWITRLFVNTTGATVRRGEVLFTVYSPELVAAQEEYRIAVDALQQMGDATPEARAGAQALVDGGLQRLRNWGIADEDLAALRAGGGASQSLPLRSQSDGVVIEMMARAGKRFMPGEPLYQIADLATVWVVASVFEQDLGFVRPGQAAEVTLTAYPGQRWTGRVAFVHPAVEPTTRTARIHIELPNQDGLLKPDLFGSVEIEAGDTKAEVAIPESAVLDSGTRRVVLVDLGGGAFEPREVELGSRGDGHVEVTSGLSAGERVVVNGNFLIDAESNFKAALESFATDDEHAGH